MIAAADAGRMIACKVSMGLRNAVRVAALVLAVTAFAAPAHAQNVTTTTLTTSHNPSTVGQSVRFTARVISGVALPTGTVTIVNTTTGAALGTSTLAAATQTKLSAGSSHTCSLDSVGGVSCWGANFFGQIGDGTTTSRLTPVPVSGLSSGVTAVSAGGRHSCALTTAGGVRCWGENSFGQLGDGTTTNRLTPVFVSGLSSGVAAIATNISHSCALTNAGAVLCWGDNDFGQLGDGTQFDRLTPGPVSGLSSGVTAISVGNSHSCALTTTGAVRCWGLNSNGQIGDGTTITRLTSVPVSGLSSGVAAISAAGLHSCALTTAGGVRCWGFNGSGRLGDGTTTDRLTQVQVAVL